MKQVQFIFNGGLGNQIFQYLASKYISDKFLNIKINYALSEYIINGGRNFELNNLLVDPLIITEPYKQYGEKVYTKIINKLPFLTKVHKNKIKNKFNIINNIYYEKDTSDKFNNSLEIFFEDLLFLKNKKSKLQIRGFWHNPNAYIDKLENLNNLFINTAKLIPNYLKPNNYLTIHIRRGDYCINRKTLETYYSRFSPIQFILTALEILPSDFINMPIILISDDKEWRNNLASILSAKKGREIKFINTHNHFEDWAILRHSALNICANSTFSYTAALLNPENKNKKIRCILPQWISNEKTSLEIGWSNLPGFIEI